MHSNIPRPPAFEKAGAIDDRDPDPENPVDLFDRLVEARRQHNHTAGRKLTTALKRAGWLIVPVEPLARWAGKGGSKR